MQNKDLVLRMDPGAAAVLEQEMKQKRNSGVANAISDTFIIRLLEAFKEDSKVLLFKLEKNKLIVRRYNSLTYDEHRQT